MTDPVKVLMTTTIVAPLGLRFWDPVSQQAIGDGLDVVAYPTADPERWVMAYPNRAAIYVLRGLPGLRAAEGGVGDKEYWASPSASRSFTIVVSDREHRFLPFRFKASAPTKGVLGWPCPPPAPPPSPNAPAAVPLFSAPARPIPAGMAVIRAQLRTAAGAAAWAVLEAQVNGGPPARGLADKAGAVALIFAYPRLPATGARSPLFQQTWTVQIRARYQPATAPPDEPDLCHVLNDQPAVTLLGNLEDGQPLTSATLTYGHELVLKTKDTNTWLSEVRITP